eukprot:gnl/MRDRNA2_/MRDRNA2_106197_c0_seq1.p1 gnl/MRDRNA2_/MRDRNA2_106197_c0~~gnl/MRDRNA2_/MRDRNA2_106197_c0_seq1.p1  ORF type:complete len:1244 (-),score=293.91 gnl/MRDRNA2_/MRDRNA2_106197_c0_seq1:45-3347(-)
MAAEQVLRSNPMTGACLDTEDGMLPSPQHLNGTRFSCQEKSSRSTAKSHEPAVPSSEPMVTKGTSAESSQDAASGGFLIQLEQAYRAAVAAGDSVTADAVADAIRAERADQGMPAQAPVSSSYPSNAQAMQSLSSKGRQHIQRPPLPKESPSGRASCSIGASAMPPTESRRASGHRLSPRVNNLHARQTRPARGESELPCGALVSKGVGNWHATHKSHSRGSSKDSYIESEDEDEVQEIEENQDNSTSDTRKPVRFGSLQACSAKLDQLFANLARKRKGIASVGNLGIEKPFGSDGEAVQPSDMLHAGRGEVLSWALGLSSGNRCLFMIDCLVAPDICLDDGHENCAAIPSLYALCGLPGGKAFFGTRIRTELFHKSPRAVLREAVASIGKEADVEGPLTPEEVNLGLRSLQMQAKTCNDPAACLRVQVWRELLKSHMAGPTVDRKSRSTAPHQELGRILKMSIGDLERDAKHESLESLRASPPLWDAICKLLAGMSKVLKADVDALESQGPYAMLGVATDATDAEIKKVYRELCLKHHPDKGGDTATFQQLQQAYNQIAEDRKRGIFPKSKKSEEKQERPRDDPPQRSSEPSRETQDNEPDKEAFRPSNRFGRCSKQEGQENDERRTTSEQSGAWNQKATEAAAQQRVAESLREVEKLKDQAADAATRATKAAQSALEAMHVVNNAVLQCEGVDSFDSSNLAMDAARRLIRAMEQAGSGADAVGDAVMEMSSKAAAAGGLTQNGSMAENLTQVSLECAMQGTNAVQAAMSCYSIKEEIAQTLTTVAKDLECHEPGSQFGVEMAVASVQTLASVCLMGKASISEAADCAEAAARTAMEAFIAAQNAAMDAAASSSRSPSSQPTSAPEDAKASSSERQDASQGSPVAGRDGSRQASKEAGGTSPEHVHGRKSPGPNQEAEAPTPGSGGSRPGSGGGRARNDALLQRRIRTHQDLCRLNGEVVELQKKMHKMLRSNPLFVPCITPTQKRHVFAVMVEFLEDAVQQIQTLSGVATQDLSRKIEYELLTWLQLEQESEPCQNALCNIRTGLVKMAAVIDMEAVRALVEEEFLAKVLAIRPDVDAFMKDLLSNVMERLQKWVAEA